MQAKPPSGRVPIRPHPKLEATAEMSGAKPPDTAAANQRMKELSSFLVSWANNEPDEYHHAAHAFVDSVLKDARAGLREIASPYPGNAPSIPPHLAITIVAVGPPPIEEDIPPPPAEEPAKELSALERMAAALKVATSQAVSARDVGALATTSTTMHVQLGDEAKRRRALEPLSFGADDPVRKLGVDGRQTEKFIRLEKNGGISWGHTERKKIGNQADYWDYYEQPDADFHVVYSVAPENVAKLGVSFLGRNAPDSPVELVKKISELSKSWPGQYNSFGLAATLSRFNIPFETTEKQVPPRAWVKST